MLAAALLIAASLSNQQTAPTSQHIQDYNPPDIIIASGARGWRIEIRSGWETRSDGRPGYVYEARLTERGAAIPEGVTDTSACPALGELIDDVRELEMPRIDLLRTGELVLGPEPPPPLDGYWSTIEMRARQSDGGAVRVQIRDRTGPAWALVAEAYRRLDPCWDRSAAG